MGSGQSIDNRVDIYMQLSKPFYYVGQWVQGTVHINCKADTTYGALNLRLEEREYCHWSEGSGKNRRSYTGDLKSYENEFVLAKFDQLRTGHYSFPFAIPTSPDFPGSYQHSGVVNTRIYFPISAYLIDYLNNTKSHSYSYSLTFLQRPRITSGQVLGSKTTNPKVCCCCSQGTTKLDVVHSHNTCRGGDVVSVGVHVDNKQCKKKINNVAVRFVRHVFVQSNGGTHRLRTEYMSEQYTPLVRKFGEETYNIDVRVPMVTNGTAIGTIVANYYNIETKSSVDGCICCCGDNEPFVAAHMFVESPNPEVVIKPQIQAPAGWNPIVEPKKVFEIPVNFNYVVNPNIGAMNRQFPM